jgi:hypothetical protein
MDLDPRVVEPIGRERGSTRRNVKMAWGTRHLVQSRIGRDAGEQLAKIARWFDASEVMRLATSRNAELLDLSGPSNSYPSELDLIEAGALAGSQQGGILRLPQGGILRLPLRDGLHLVIEGGCRAREG